MNTVTSNWRMRIPEHEHREAEALGVYWDSKEKEWFAPKGADLTPLMKWLANHRCGTYQILEATLPCSHCGKTTRAFRFLLPEHDAVVDHGNQRYRWQSINASVVAIEIAVLAPSVVERIRALSPGYGPIAHHEMGDLWVNRCDHCSEVIDDELLQTGPGDVFDLTQIEAGKVITHDVKEPFLAVLTAWSLFGEQEAIQSAIGDTYLMPTTDDEVGDLQQSKQVH